MSEPRKNILVTGFEAFGRKHSNASSRALDAIRESGVSEVVMHRLPVEFGRAALELCDVIRAGEYSHVLMMGEAPSIVPTIKLEEAARNRAVALQIPDNARRRAIGRIVGNGPRTIKANMQYDQLENNLRGLGIRTERSNNAGSFVCNELFYRALLAQQQNETLRDVEFGFMHISGYHQNSKAEHRLHDVLPDAIKDSVLQ